jgi:hypothetical protein
MAARLASSAHVSALLRLAEAEGGFAAVVAKGDATAGSIAIILAERGEKCALLERLLQPDGRYAWRDSGQGVGNADEFERFLARRRQSDPDLWIIELDVPSAERFAAEMNALD